MDEFTVCGDVSLCVRVSCCVRQTPAQPLSTEDAEWEGDMASMLEAPQGNASYLPHTVPHTHSTLSVFVNGVLVTRPCPWGGASGKKPDLASGAKAGAAAGTRSGGCFAVRFRHEGDSVEVKVMLCICLCVHRQGGRNPVCHDFLTCIQALLLLCHSIHHLRRHLHCHAPPHTALFCDSLSQQA